MYVIAALRLYVPYASHQGWQSIALEVRETAWHSEIGSNLFGRSNLLIEAEFSFTGEISFWFFREHPGHFAKLMIISANLCRIMLNGNVKKCAVGKHPKSEKHGNTAQFSCVPLRSTSENCGGIGSGCRLRLRPLPVLHRRQSQRVARIDPNAVVVDKNIAENDRFDLFPR